MAIQVFFARVSCDLERRSFIKCFSQGVVQRGLQRAVVFCLLAWGSNLPARSDLVRQKPCVSNHVLIQFKSEERARIARLAGPNELPALLSKLGLPAGAQLELTQFEKLQKQSTGWPATESAAADSMANHHMYLRLPVGADVSETIRKLQSNSLVEYAEADSLVRAQTTFPTDPNFSSQWFHYNPYYSFMPVRPDIHSPEAWDITTGSSNVIVAVLDTGINASLVEFAGRLVPGYDFVNNDNDPDDDSGHGTSITSILGANANNATSFAGVDWHCKIMPIKVLLPDGDNGLASWLADGIDWATAHGCKVINMSLAETNFSQTVARSITNAIAHGVIVVTLTSNEGTDQILFPGNLTNVITVGSTDIRDSRAGFSNYGPEIDLVAPGQDIAILERDGSPSSGSGTSTSVPMVSGVAALLASIRPNLSHEEARTYLCAGADDLVGNPGEDTPGFDIYYGWGRLNAYNSLILAQTRIQSIQITNQHTQLKWACPPNAVSKKPYRIDSAVGVTGPWTSLTYSNIAFTTNQATWQDPGEVVGTNTSTAKFYRLRVVAE